MSWTKPVDPEYEAIKVTLTPANWKLSLKNLAACSLLNTIKAEMSKELVTVELSFDPPLNLSSIYGLGTFNSLEVCTRESLLSTEHKFDYESEMNEDEPTSKPLIPRPSRPALHQTSPKNPPVGSMAPARLKRSVSVMPEQQASKRQCEASKAAEALNKLGKKLPSAKEPAEIARQFMSENSDYELKTPKQNKTIQSIPETDDEDTDCDLS
jgi:hypothetical protein